LSAIAVANGEALRWSSKDFPRNGRLLVSTNPDPAVRPVIDQRNPGFAVPLSALGAGTYYWTVRATNNDGKDISAETVAAFTIAPPERFPAPENRSPPDGWVMGAAQARASRSITFTWAPVAGANRYIFTLYALDGGRRDVVAQTAAQTGTTYVLADAAVLKGSDFAWAVEAILVAGPRVEQNGVVAENRFRMDIPAPSVSILNPGTLYGE
jgi:hypothetical protein